MDDVNRKVRLTPLNPRGERHLDPIPDGDAAGFRRHYRRPRTTMTDECMPLDRADSVEALDRDMRGYRFDYDD